MLKVKGNDRSRKAQMPLALVAVVLLVTGSFFGVVYADIDRAADNSENMATELMSLDTETDRARAVLESEIGRMINDISSAPDGGNLVERAERFNTMMDGLIKDSYPRFERGVTTSIVSSDVRLELESYRSDSDDFFTGGGCASFLRAEGTVGVLLQSESASVSEKLSIEADATSGLPLVLETATRFELSGKGSMSVLTQMLEYQLSSLAQHRVMQGYGMSNGTGNSTDDILTSDDVAHALRNGVSVLQTMFFRDNAEGDGELVNACRVDVAEMFAAEDGNLRIDVGSLVSQALLSELDAHVTGWMDYLGTDIFADLAEKAVDGLGKYWRGLIGLFTGKDTDREALMSHIDKQMDMQGLRSGPLLRPFGGESVSVAIPQFTFTVRTDDETIVETTGPRIVSVELPDVDVMSWGGWDGFVDRYENERNSFRESLKGIVRTIADTMCGSLVVVIPIDMFDSRSLSEDYLMSAENLVDLGMKEFNSTAADTVNTNKVSDPMMLAAYKDICDSSSEIFRTDEFSDSVRKAVMSCAMGTGLLADVPPDEKDRFMEMIERDVVAPQTEAYMERVKGCVDDLRAITAAREMETGKITKALALSAETLIDTFDLRPSVENALRGVLDEMVEYSCISPFDGPVSLPAEPCFSLADEDGRKYREWMDVTDRVSVDASVTSPADGDRNVHMTGFGDSSRAAYVSYFTVTVDATVDYTVKSTNPVFDSLGMHDAEYTGSFRISAVLDIPCISAWALAEADYKESNTLLGDIWNKLLEALEPLIGPIKRMIRAVQTVTGVMSSAVMEFANYLGEMAKEVYETLMEPVSVLIDTAGTAIEGILENVGLVGVDLTGKGQTLVFDIYGVELEVHLNLRSLSKEKKELMTLTVRKEFSEGTGLSVSVKLMKSAAEGCYVLLSAGAKGEDWRFSISADPFQKNSAGIITIDGRTRDVGYFGTMPELVQYNRIGVTLGDIPGIGTVLSNIPLPIPGVKAGIDAGFSLKYNVPVKPGVLINEVEANPPGDDKGHEWAEILNNTHNSVDLEGYRLIPASSERKAVTLDSTVLAPGQRTVVVFERPTVNNINETLKLTDPEGNTVDETPCFSDSDNSTYTMQRVFDGCTVWKHLPGTQGGRNGGELTDGFGLGPMLLEMVKESALDVLDEMGGKIGSVEEFSEYLKNVIKDVIAKAISMVGDCIQDACVFLELELADATGSGHAGIRISVGFDGQLIADGIRYLLSMVPFLGEYVANPNGMTAERIMYQDIYLRVTVFTGMSMPSFLGSLADTQQNVGVSVRTNLSAITEMIGDGKGDWSAQAGLVLENVPSALLPPVFDADPDKRSDLWLINMHFGRAEAE